MLWLALKNRAHAKSEATQSRLDLPAHRARARAPPSRLTLVPLSQLTSTDLSVPLDTGDRREQGPVRAAMVETKEETTTNDFPLYNGGQGA